MKRISHNSRSRDKLLHIETDLGIINVRVGLQDSDGRDVESVEIVPDQYAGETPVIVDGFRINRLVRGGKAAPEVKAPSDDEIRTEIFLWVEALEGNGLIITDTDLLQDTLKNADMDSVKELFGVTS